MTMNEYLERYPWTRGYDPYPEDGEELVCALMWLPTGWIKAFGEEMCDEIDAALRKADFYDQAYISEVKEKYGSMRLWIHPSNEEIDRIIMKYETISEAVCMSCGRVDCGILNISGWLSTYCRECYDNINADGRHKPYDEIVNKDAKMPDAVKWSRYSTSGTEHFEMDISETTQKIRDKYAQRKANSEFNNNDFDEWDDRYNGA